MLTAHQLHIDGRRHTLLPATSVEAPRGQVLLIQADGQERRTALSLALTGRMKPSTGTVSLGHESSMASLRRRSAIVDAPDVNAPENHLTVRSLTSEDLALVPLKFRDRTRPTEWLVRHGFRDILQKWVEELEPARLLHLQLELALANKDVDVVVVDSPDRHTADVAAWLPLLEQTASGTMGLDPDAPADAPLRPLMVIGVVGRLPDEWGGSAAVAGNALNHPLLDGAEPPAAVVTEPNRAEDTAPTEDAEPAEAAAEAAAASPAAKTEPPARETAKHTTEEIQ
ncbi:ABC transporter ATP-binding protein [Arthrobacter sp. HLT1-20]